MERNYFVDKLATLKVPAYGVSLNTYYCGDKVAYKMYLNGKLLFKGADFKPSPLFDWDSFQSSLDLLSFLSVKPFDTDSSYFENYTPAQLEWSDSFECEQLGCLISDVEDEDGEYYAESIKQFKHKIW